VGRRRLDQQGTRDGAFCKADRTNAIIKSDVLDLVRLKRTLRRRLMRSRDSADKREYRRSEDDLKKLLHRTKSEYFGDLVRKTDSTKSIGFNPWEARRNTK